MAIQLQPSRTYLAVRTDQISLTEEEAKEIVNSLKQVNDHFPMVIFDFGTVKEASLNALRLLTRVVSSFSQQETKVAVVSSKEVSGFITAQGLDRIFPCYTTMEQVINLADPVSNKQRAIEFLNTTLEAVTYTMQVSCNTKPVAKKSFVRSQSGTPMTVDIAASVGLISPVFNGALIIGFPLKTYLALMSRMLMQEFTEMTPDISDGAAELLNMVLGQVKISLNEKGYSIKQAIPTVVKGNQVQITPSSQKPSIIIPYTTEIGDFYIELSTDPMMAEK